MLLHLHSSIKPHGNVLIYSLAVNFIFTHLSTVYPNFVLDMFYFSLSVAFYVLLLFGMLLGNLLEIYVTKTWTILGTFT